MASDREHIASSSSRGLINDTEDVDNHSLSDKSSDSDSDVLDATEFTELWQQDIANELHASVTGNTNQVAARHGSTSSRRQRRNARTNHRAFGNHRLVRNFEWYISNYKD